MKDYTPLQGSSALGPSDMFFRCAWTAVWCTPSCCIWHLVLVAARLAGRYTRLPVGFVRIYYIICQYSARDAFKIRADGLDTCRGAPGIAVPYGLGQNYKDRLIHINTQNDNYV